MTYMSLGNQRIPHASDDQNISGMMENIFYGGGDG